MEIKEAIRKIRQADILYSLPELSEAYTTAIFHLETLQKVQEMGGVKKYLTYDNEEIQAGNGSVTELSGRYKAGWNDCVDLKDAELAGKLEGLKEVINKVLRDDILPSGARKWVLHGSYDMFREELSNKIQELILGKKEE